MKAEVGSCFGNLLGDATIGFVDIGDIKTIERPLSLFLDMGENLVIGLCGGFFGPEAEL